MPLSSPYASSGIGNGVPGWASCPELSAASAMETAITASVNPNNNFLRGLCRDIGKRRIIGPETGIENKNAMPTEAAPAHQARPTRQMAKECLKKRGSFHSSDEPRRRSNTTDRISRPSRNTPAANRTAPGPGAPPSKGSRPPLLRPHQAAATSLAIRR